MNSKASVDDNYLRASDDPIPPANETQPPAALASPADLSEDSAESDDELIDKKYDPYTQWQHPKARYLQDFSLSTYVKFTLKCEKNGYVKDDDNLGESEREHHLDIMKMVEAGNDPNTAFKSKCGNKS